MAREAARSLEIPYDFNLSWDEATKKYDAALDAAAKAARAKNPGDMVGETIKWGVADGYAVYMIVKQKPLIVQHVDWGDGYRVDPIMIRGLRLSDVRQKVEARKLFGF
jgi:hypothetical protein